MSFEEQLENSFFKGPSEKTFIDKMLGRDDVESVRKIISKTQLDREDMMKLLNLLSSNESKLWNYGEWDRYIMAKFFVWIREFVAVAENLYDYKDDLERKTKSCANCNNRIGDKENPCNCGENFKPVFKLKKDSYQIFNNITRLLEHNVKFLVDLYFNLSRTTLSLGATGLLELLKNKYEVVYPEKGMTQTQPQQPTVQLKWRKT